MPLILEMFPPVVQALNQEVRNHPILLSELSRLQALNGKLDLEITVGVVAAYCNIMLADQYMEEDLEALFTMLLARLQKISAITVH